MWNKKLVRLTSTIIPAAIAKVRLCGELEITELLRLIHVSNFNIRQPLSSASPPPYPRKVTCSVDRELSMRVLLAAAPAVVYSSYYVTIVWGGDMRFVQQQPILASTTTHRPKQRNESVSSQTTMSWEIYWERVATEPCTWPREKHPLLPNGKN